MWIKVQRLVSPMSSCEAHIGLPAQAFGVGKWELLSSDSKDIVWTSGENQRVA